MNPLTRLCSYCSYVIMVLLCCSYCSYSIRDSLTQIGGATGAVARDLSGGFRREYIGELRLPVLYRDEISCSYMHVATIRSALPLFDGGWW